MSTMMTAPASTMPVSPTARSKRSDESITADLARVRSEYVEMPGLVLTLPQAARLYGFSTQRAAEILAALLDSGFLVCDRRTVYRRRR